MFVWRIANDSTQGTKSLADSVILMPVTIRHSQQLPSHYHIVYLEKCCWKRLFNCF